MHGSKWHQNGTGMSMVKQRIDSMCDASTGTLRSLCSIEHPGKSRYKPYTKCILSIGRSMIM